MEISYFPQSEAKLNGASALKMLLDTLGYKRDISTIWNAVANNKGTGCRTVALACYALYVGASAVIIRTQQPKTNLFANVKNNIYTLVNIRLNAESGYGRFAIVEYVDKGNVFLCDPMYGQHYAISWKNFLQLWEPPSEGWSEVTGRIFIAITRHSIEQYNCPICNFPIPLQIVCPNCKQIINLSPLSTLGCINHNCNEKLWEHIICPYCDKAFFDLYPADFQLESHNSKSGSEE